MTDFQKIYLIIQFIYVWFGVIGLFTLFKILDELEKK